MFELAMKTAHRELLMSKERVFQIVGAATATMRTDTCADRRYSYMIFLCRQTIFRQIIDLKHSLHSY